ncbi:MAG: cellulose binding domain-containing protein, partial [Butyrivibrio sp.]|nr:cellulose binding domain-containing protein [Butyrivibrio sp.]
VSVKVTNESNKRTEGWTVKVNKEDVDIDASWNVNVTEEGGYYVITPVEWNAVIDAGKSVEFGFQGSSHIKDKIELFAVGEVKDEPTPEPQPTPDPEPQPEPTPDPEPQPTPDPEPQPEPTPEPEPVVVNDGLVLGYEINGQGSFTISFNVSNNGDSAVNGWTLKLKKSQLTIDNSWCVKIASEGDYYVITPETWNYVINAGDAAYFGIQGSGEVGTTLDYILE